MDAFEYIVSRAFEARGFWTRIGFKVELDKKTKAEIGNPSMPRPEIDILAYKPSEGNLLLIECKSYLDSLGVQARAFLEPDAFKVNRFKLFHDEALLAAVKRQVLNQLAADGMLGTGTPEICLCLVAGKVYGNDEEKIRNFFNSKGWMFIGPAELVADLRKFAKRGYENDVATIAVKLLERNLPQAVEESEFSKKP